NIFDGKGCWQVYSGVGVLGVHIVDGHVDSFALGIVREESRYLDGGGLGQYRLAAPGSPGQMNQQREYECVDMVTLPSSGFVGRMLIHGRRYRPAGGRPGKNR